MPARRIVRAVVHSSFYRGLEAAQQRLAALAASAATDPVARAAAGADLLEQLVAQTGTGDWACRAGCDHCCHHPVGATFAEVVRLARAIAAQPSDRAATLRRRVVEAAAATQQLAWKDLARRPCPLLEQGKCSLYDQRPLACRAWGSTDAIACADDRAGAAVAVPFDRTAFGLGLGVGQALAGDRGHRELRAALAAVLQAPAAAAAAFAAARTAGGDGPTAAPPPGEASG